MKKIAITYFLMSPLLFLYLGYKTALYFYQEISYEVYFLSLVSLTIIYTIANYIFFKELTKGNN